ncbi:MAG: type I DNA topoisomerase [Bacteroidales bacterium]|nr:type I DNA topoisomerase [Bacteroidales bacterium]MCL2132928.1 type I DNA topoisomerase [Bacteroidales bacterium]
MQENLVIVESPAKAKTIERFLGKDFLVKSSYGHIRDLAKKQHGVNIDNNFEPDYEISADKLKIVDELKKLVKKSAAVWLASDEDREGEAIAWHLQEVLKLDPKKTKRIVFHEITKNAIIKAVENPRQVDMNLVNAQQARRILDRLVGFEVSPILWKKVKPALSAGRVQSVAVRLIVEREREILNFTLSSAYRVSALFEPIEKGEKFSLKAELSERFATEKAALAFLEKCKKADFAVRAIEKKPAKKSPSAPFTTSTLQQEASRRFGFSVSQTMNIAQRLYEAGLITYMRTDSTNLSDLALNTSRQTIENLFGKQYYKRRQYAAKSKGAQEAHEAIRPTYMENAEIEGTAQEKKLYDLIWKRTIASQMADAQLEKTTVDITISTAPQIFQAIGEVLLFDGFLKVYMETGDDESDENAAEGILPPLKEKQALSAKTITATERFAQRPPRYTEAGLVKRLEELGIGRPSTYAPTISTIMNRGYVLKEDRAGLQREYICLTLKKEVLSKQQLTEIAGAEKGKLFPSDIGILVNDFLVEHFKNIMDYGFTAKVEEEFDEIAEGKLVWNKMLSKFYKPFHKVVENALEISRPTNAERVLGVDPKSGKSVSVRIGRFGPVAQLGEADDEKKQFASLQKGQLIESITLEEALKLFELPRPVGQYEGEEIIASTGRFGPYVRHGKVFVSLKKDDSPYTVSVERAIELIEEKRKKEKEKFIKIFEKEDIQVLNGRFGPYIAHAGANYRIPKGTDPAALSLADCRTIIAAQQGKEKNAAAKPKAKARPAVGKTSAKSATAKKTQ